MARTRKTQIGFGLENIENVGLTLTSSEAIPVRPGVSFTPSFGRVQRELAKDSLDPVQGTTGLRSGTVSFVMDLQGSGDLDPTTPPPWLGPMRGCGVDANQAKAASYSSFAAGTVTVAGEAYTQATSGATGIVYGVFRAGDTFMTLVPDAGSAPLATGNLITCASSAVTFTPLTLGDSWGFRLSSRNSSTISIASITGGGFAVDDEIEQDQGSGVFARGRVLTSLTAAGTLEFEHYIGSATFDDSADIDVVGGGSAGGVPTASSSQVAKDTPSASIWFNRDGHGFKMRGARGTWNLEMRNGQPAAFTFDFTGVMSQPGDLIPFTFPGDGAVPPNVTGGAYRLGDDFSFAPFISSAAVAIGNNVELRENANDSSGYAGTVLGSRTPTAQMDPEQVKEVVYPLVGNAWDQTAFRARFSVGNLAGVAGNAFQIYMPAAQVSQATPTDRGGQATLDHQWALTGNNDEALFIYVV